MRAEALQRLRDDPVDWRYKAFPPAEGVTPANIHDQGWNLLAGDLFLPALVLRESALDSNLDLMRRWCADRGASLAPHGKTTMSPEIFARQLGAGAWAMTAATASQMRVYRAFGIERIILANELVEPASLRWLAGELASDPAFEAYCLVDSLAAISRMEAALVGHAGARRIKVLVELGVSGGRTGARTIATAIAVAEAALRSPVLQLAGLECYEGVLEDDAERIGQFLSRLRSLVEELGRRGVLAELGEVIVSAGGSEAFDQVVDQLGRLAEGLQTRLVLRSGCYVTHDDGVYDERSPLGSRRAPTGERFIPALEAWGVVLARPEPSLALVGMGKRDVPFDDGYPIPLKVAGAMGLRHVRDTMQVIALNDQHAFMRVPADDPLAIGDLLSCGISHPCTAFDKWRLIPVVNDAYDVIDAFHTFF